MILNKKNCEKHDLQLIFFRLVCFWINFFSPCQILNQIFFCLVRFRVNFFTTRQILNHFFEHASDFKSTFWTRVSFWLEYFTARQILSVLLLQFGEFSCVDHNMSRFRNVLRYSVGSVSHVICWKRLCVPQLWPT